MRRPGALAVVIFAAGWAICTLPVNGQGLAPGEKPAALVNGEPVTVAEVKAVLDQRPSPVPLTAAQQKELRQAALDVIIDDVLMRQFLRKAGGAVAPGAIEHELDDLKAVLNKQGKTLAQFLRESKQTEEQLRADVVARLQWKQYLRARYTDADCKTYYDANKVVFDKVQARVSHILVKTASSASPMEKALARSKLETIRSEILTGKLDFAEAARRYSDCTASKDKGGDIGLATYKLLVEPIARTAFTIKEGDLSEVVASEFGFHILRVTERTRGEPSTFDGSRELIRETMAQEHELFPRILAEQRKGAKIEVLLP